jgi:hypothetical protein
LFQKDDDKVLAYESVYCSQLKQMFLSRYTTPIIYNSKFAKDHLFDIAYFSPIKIIFPLTIHLYLIILYLSYRFVIYTLQDKHVEKHTHGNLVFCFHLNVYKQQDCKTEINKLWQIEKLDVVLVKMR